LDRGHPVIFEVCSSIDSSGAAEEEKSPYRILFLLHNNSLTNTRDKDPLYFKFGAFIVWEGFLSNYTVHDRKVVYLRQNVCLENHL